MSRVENILLRVRDTLGDHAKSRWDDELLIRLLNEAQIDICRRAKLLRSQVSQIITDGVSEYEMPEDFLLLDKVDINKVRIPLIGHTELDKNYPKWTTKSGEVKFIVYDKQTRGKIRLFPTPDYRNGSRFIPVNAYQSYRYGKIHDRFGCITNAPATCEFPTGIYGFTHSIEGVFQYYEAEIPKVFNKHYQLQSLYGLVSDVFYSVTPDVPAPIEGGEISSVEGAKNSQEFGIISGFQLGKEVDMALGDKVGIYYNGSGGYYTSFVQFGEIGHIDGSSADKFGVLTNLDAGSFKNISFDGVFGVTTSLETKDNVMDIYYLRKPKPITSLQSEIDIDESLDKALKYYITAMAFRDNIDAQNRAMGLEELKLYERELEQAKLDDSSDFTRNDSIQYETSYNGWGL